MKRRALLISGGINPEMDRPRYRNDIAAFFHVLVDTYGFEPNDIRVCMGAGGPLEAPNDRVVLANPASYASVLSSLLWFATLGEHELGFMMVTDHGSPDGISLWRSTECLEPREMASILDASPATKVLVFGQCHSGIFGLSPPRNSIVLCACDANSSSYPIPRPAPGVEPSYNEFLYQLAGALGGVYPDGTKYAPDDAPPPPAQVTIQDAFDYARDHDRWFGGLRQHTERPQLIDPNSLASLVRLSCK